MDIDHSILSKKEYEELLIQASRQDFDMREVLHICPLGTFKRDIKHDCACNVLPKSDYPWLISFPTLIEIYLNQIGHKEFHSGLLYNYYSFLEILKDKTVPRDWPANLSCDTEDDEEMHAYYFLQAFKICPKERYLSRTFSVNFAKFTRKMELVEKYPELYQFLSDIEKLLPEWASLYFKDKHDEELVKIACEDFLMKKPQPFDIGHFAHIHDFRLNPVTNPWCLRLIESFVEFFPQHCALLPYWWITEERAKMILKQHHGNIRYPLFNGFLSRWFKSWISGDEEDGEFIFDLVYHQPLVMNTIGKIWHTIPFLDSFVKRRYGNDANSRKSSWEVFCEKMFELNPLVWEFFPEPHNYIALAVERNPYIIVKLTKTEILLRNGGLLKIRPSHLFRTLDILGTSNLIRIALASDYTIWDYLDISEKTEELRAVYEMEKLRQTIEPQYSQDLDEEASDEEASDEEASDEEASDEEL